MLLGLADACGSAGLTCSARGLATLLATAVLVAWAAGRAKRLGPMVFAVADVVDVGCGADAHRALDPTLPTVPF